MKRLALVCLLALEACGHRTGKRLIVLGVDGMDPNFVERHWAQLPNLRRLQSGLSRLRTTQPPQSPVAWSTFATGLPPEQHGIFDFVHRDPATGRAMSSMGETEPPRWIIPLGPWQFPLSQARVQSFRRGVTFWELLERAGIPVTMVRMPVNYPPVPYGDALSGMGTPDLEGTFGSFTDYTDDPEIPSHEVQGGRFVHVDLKGGRTVLPVGGPPDPYRRDGRRLMGEIIVDVDPETSVLRISVEDRISVIAQGEWSPWISIRLGPARGMFRLYIREVYPRLRIYRSPLNADPAHSALRISRPASFSVDLAHRAGTFYTQGIPEDTSAVRQGALGMEQYLQQSHFVAGEERRMLDACLDRFHDGLLFFYFSEVDQDSHMLWGRDDNALLNTYRGVDAAIGRVMARAPDAELIVMSDHGFARFDQAVDLNAFFRDEKLPAVGLGLNAVYVSQAGRRAEVKRHLEGWLDPVTGDKVVSKVVEVGSSWSPYAPDLIVGYAAGYRAAFSSTATAAITANTDAWVGDHCIDAALVPGVFLSTRKHALQDTGLEDLTVTILREFGVTPDDAMKGRDAWQKN